MQTNPLPLKLIQSLKPHNILFLSDLNLIMDVTTSEVAANNFMCVQGMVTFLSGVLDNKDLVRSISTVVISGKLMNSF